MSHTLKTHLTRKKKIATPTNFLLQNKHYLLNTSLSRHLLIIPCTRTQNNDANKYIQIQAHINTYAYSFYPRVLGPWNLLPTEIIRLPSIHLFQLATSTVYFAPPAHISDCGENFISATHIVSTIFVLK